MTQHADFASTAAAPAHDPWVGTMARNAAAPPSAAAPVDTSITPPSLALHARQVALSGASVSFVSAPDLPDVMRPAGPVAEVDRTLHPPFPSPAVVVVKPDAPLPGTVPATVDDPWRPVQHFPTPQPDALARPVPICPGISLDSADGAAQLAVVAHSRARLDRARAYAGRLGSRLAGIRAKLTAASDRRVGAAIGTAGLDPADVGPLRGEAIEVERLHRQALDVLADVEAEHARHEADLATLIGSDGAARAKLAEAHTARALAQAAADAAKAILDRASAHAEAVLGRLELARADETRHDAEATARLRAALAEGDAPPAAVEPLVRASGALEDDLRAATAAADALKAEHDAKVKALAAADLAVRGAVDGVLCAEAEAMARELMAADARSLALRIRLHCYTSRRAGDYVAPVPKPPKLLPNGMYEHDPASAIAMMAAPRTVPQTAVIGTALAAAPVPQSGGLVAPAWTVEHDGWARYAAALAADPEAGPAFADGLATPPASRAA